MVRTRPWRYQCSDPVNCRSSEGERCFVMRHLLSWRRYGSGLCKSSWLKSPLVMKVKRGPPAGGPETSFALRFGVVRLRLGQHDAAVEVQRQGFELKRQAVALVVRPGGADPGPDRLLAFAFPDGVGDQCGFLAHDFLLRIARPPQRGLDAYPSRRGASPAEGRGMGECRSWNKWESRALVFRAAGG